MQSLRTLWVNNAHCRGTLKLQLSDGHPSSSRSPSFRATQWFSSTSLSWSTSLSHTHIYTHTTLSYTHTHIGLSLTHTYTHIHKKSLSFLRIRQNPSKHEYRNCAMYWCYEEVSKKGQWIVIDKENELFNVNVLN